MVQKLGLAGLFLSLGIFAFSGCGSSNSSNVPQGAGGVTSNQPCSSSATCAPPYPYCAGVCVECLGDANCSNGKKCDLTTHSCQYTCTSNSNCTIASGTPYCSPGGICVQCTQNSNCPVDRQACLNGSCVQCVDNTTCTAGAPYCNASTNRCVECLSDGNCPTGQKCNLTDHTCQMTCASNNDCSAAGGAPYCSPTTHLCVECLANTNCPTDAPVCLSGACVECIDNTTCSGGTPYCDTARNRCVECITDAQCGGGRCANGFCR